MKKEIEELSQKLYDITSQSCMKNCDRSKDCCDDFFCSKTEMLLNKMGKKYKKPNHKKIRYMSKDGCVIPPKHRPLCSGFGCSLCLNGLNGSLDKLMKLDCEMKKRLHVFMNNDETN